MQTPNGPNLTTKNPKPETFDFPKLAPERSWGNDGMVGHAETCSKHTPAPATRTPLPYMHDVVEAEHGNDKENIEFPKSPKYRDREF